MPLEVQEMVNAINTPQARSSALGSIGWLSYRMMSVKPISIRRLIFGVLFSAFTTSCVFAALKYFNFQDFYAVYFAAALGAVCEKTRSFFTNKIKENS